MAVQHTCRRSVLHQTGLTSYHNANSLEILGEESSKVDVAQQPPHESQVSTEEDEAIHDNDRPLSEPPAFNHSRLQEILQTERGFNSETGSQEVDWFETMEMIIEQHMPMMYESWTTCNIYEHDEEVEELITSSDRSCSATFKR